MGIADKTTKAGPPGGGAENGQQAPRSLGQAIWGAMLILAGLGVFVRIHQVMPKVAAFTQFAAATGFIRFCFYLMGILLIGGGARKIYAYFQGKRAC